MAGTQDYQADLTDDDTDQDDDLSGRGVRIAALVTVFTMALILSAFSTSFAPERADGNTRAVEIKVSPAPGATSG